MVPRILLPLALNLALVAGALGLARRADRIPVGYSLYEHGGWHATKALLAEPTIGAVSFFVTPVALAGGRLDLGAWHGENEVIHVQPVDLGRLELDLGLAPGARLTVIFGRHPGGFSGLRLCAAGACQSLFFDAAPGGRFVRRQPVSVDQAAGLTHHLTLKRRGATISARLGQRELGSFALVRPGPGQWGFRGGLGSAWVDNLVLVDRQGTEVLREDFGPRRRSPLPLPAVALCLLGVSLAVYLRHRRRRPRIALYLVAVGNALVLLSAAASLLLLQTFVRVYPDAPEDVHYYGFSDSSRSSAQIIDELEHRFGRNPRQPGELRLLLLGGSQVAGEGASTPDRIAANRLCALLNADPRLRARFRCLNAGLPGARAKQLLQDHLPRWDYLSPDLVLINLGFNDAVASDPDPPALSRRLGRAVREFRRRGARVLLCTEPTLLEGEMIGRMHRAVRRAALISGAPVVPMQRHFQGQLRRGFVFWDRVHLTDFGQELWARRAARAVGELMGLSGRPTGS